MIVLLFFITVLVLFDLAAIRWSVDSRYDFNSPEYDRRRNWRGYTVR